MYLQSEDAENYVYQDVIFCIQRGGEGKGLLLKGVWGVRRGEGRVGRGGNGRREEGRGR